MTKTYFNAQIQALRALAVLLVVMYHGGIEMFAGGYIGVDVFFVISGYLITGLLLRELRTTGSVNFRQFYARRVRRLLPAAAIVLLATTVAAWLTFSPLDFKQYTSTAIATAAYASNFWFAHIATDYLAAGVHSDPLLHTWSLSVEEQFYLIWPLLIFLFYRVAGKPDRPGVLMAGLATLCAVSFGASVYFTEANQPLAFFGSPMRAWEFGIGGLIAVYQRPASAAATASKLWMSVAGLALLAWCATSFTDATLFPGLAASLPVAATALLIVGSINAPASRLTGWMSARPIQYIGNISYALYLWHWPVITFLDHADGLTPGYAMAAYFLLSFLLASITYHLVENPARFSPLLARRTLNSFAFGASVTVATIAIAFGLRGATLDELASPAQKHIERAAKDIPQIYHDGCHLSFVEVEPGECIYGAVKSGKVMVLFGDSHAAQWFPALEHIADELGYALVTLTKSNCPSMHYEPYSATLRRAYIECTQWREHAFERIASLAPDLVLLSNASHHALTGAVAGGPVERERWLKATTATYEKIARLGVPIALIRDTPRLPFNAPSCLSRAAWKDLNPALTCHYSMSAAANRAIFEIEQNQLLNFPDSIAIDMTRQICATGRACRTQRDGMVLFHDSDHLTAQFGRHLAAPLLRQLRRVGIH